MTDSASVEVLEDHPRSNVSEQYLGAWVPETKDSRRYKMSAFLEGALSGAMFHEPSKALQQSKTQSCVGHDGRAWELGNPNPAKRDAHDDRDATLTDNPLNPATELYFNAQRNDDWAGGEYPGASPTYQGSSLHGLAKYYVSRGVIRTGYAWANGPADLQAWIRSVAGVMFAARWTQDAFTPDAQGFVHFNGNVVGGHAYYLFGVDQGGNVYGINSWGSGWGKRMKFTNPDGSSFTVDGGCFIISPQDQQKLFDMHNAEGFSPVKVAAPAPKPAPPAPPAPTPQDQPISRYKAMRLDPVDKEYQVVKYRKPWATIAPPKS